MFKQSFAVLLFLAVATAASAQTIVMTVDGLVCAFCAQGINKRLRAFDATEDVYVSLEKKIVALSLKAGQDISDEVLRQNLTESGYTVRTITRSAETLETVRARKATP